LDLTVYRTSEGSGRIPDVFKMMRNVSGETFYKYVGAVRLTGKLHMVITLHLYRTTTWWPV